MSSASDICFVSHEMQLLLFATRFIFNNLRQLLDLVIGSKRSQQSVVHQAYLLFTNVILLYREVYVTLCDSLEVKSAILDGVRDAAISGSLVSVIFMTSTRKFDFMILMHSFGVAAYDDFRPEYNSLYPLSPRFFFKVLQVHLYHGVTAAGACRYR